MALKKCVLVSDIPENLETIGDAGISFKNGNIDDLREKIRKLFNEPEIVIKYEKKAVSRINNHYNWDNITAELEKVYAYRLSKLQVN